MKTIKELKELDISSKAIEEVEEKFKSSSKIEASGYVEKLKGVQLQKTTGKGIPIAIKNNINVKGWTIDCSSKILEGYIAPTDAKVISKMRGAGFVPYGTTNMDEFAMGSTTATSTHGKTFNPVNPECVPGGSSGGSAAVVASGMAIAALGSDTGGSVRQPAAFCGIVGFKPAYGHVSRNGLIAYASSLDQIGTLTQTVEDSAILYDAIKGYDPDDSTSLDIEYKSSYEAIDRNKNYTIGYVKEYIDNCEEDLKNDIYAAIDKLKGAGHTVVEKKLFDTDLLISAYYTIATAEASSNLSRFTGIEYGKRADNYTDLTSLYKNTRTQGFGEEVKKRIMLGSFVLSSGYYDAYYNQAKKVQHQVKVAFEKVFEECDTLIMPVAPTTAFRFDKKLTDLEMYLNDIYTISINMAGLAGMAMPTGEDRNGMPTSLQLVSTAENEQVIFDVGVQLETLINDDLKAK